MAWHLTHSSSSGLSPPSSPTQQVTEVDKLESLLQRQYVQKKLESGLGRIWQDVQTKVRVLVLSSNLAELDIDLFIQFLDIIHTLILVGKEFSGVTSETLEESLEKQCLAYFQVPVDFKIFTTTKNREFCCRVLLSLTGPFFETNQRNCSPKLKLGTKFCLQKCSYSHHLLHYFLKFFK
jgi:hypothetical protein